MHSNEYLSHQNISPSHTFSIPELMWNLCPVGDLKLIAWSQVAFLPGSTYLEGLSLLLDTCGTSKEEIQEATHESQFVCGAQL